MLQDTEALSGTRHDDLLRSDARVFIANGHRGDDRLIFNGQDYANLDGGRGDDTLVCRGGASAIFHGGPGSDAFVFRDLPHGRVIITDMTALDKLVIEKDLGDVSILGDFIYINDQFVASVQGDWNGDILYV